MEVRARELESHPLMNAAPCSRPPGAGAWVEWIEKLAHRAGSHEARVLGPEGDLVASRLHPEAFGIRVERIQETEVDGLVLGSLDPMERLERVPLWSSSMSLPDCPWLRVELLWPWDESLGRWIPYDSTATAVREEGVLWLSKDPALADGPATGVGHPAMGVAMSETSPDDEGSTAAATRMILYALGGGLLVMLAGWLLLLPQRRAWGRVERQAAGAWERMRDLYGTTEKGQEPPPPEELLRMLSEEAQDLASRAERLANAAGWKDVGRAIGHEVRNALTPLRLTVGTLAIRSRDDPRMMEGLQSAQVSLERVQRLVEEFSRFARIPPAKLREEDLNSLGEKGVQAWSGAGPPSMEIAPHPEPLPVNVDPDLLERVLQNLLKNAREAAGAEGQVKVSLARPDSLARLTVWNSGAPIPEALMEDIFRGGHTTKPTGHGLGLAIARELTSRMRGSIRVENAADGVAFHLEFPLAGKAE
jgi:signal transduction histidine kinase